MDFTYRRFVNLPMRALRAGWATKERSAFWYGVSAKSTASFTDLPASAGRTESSKTPSSPEQLRRIGDSADLGPAREKGI